MTITLCTVWMNIWMPIRACLTQDVYYFPINNSCGDSNWIPENSHGQPHGVINENVSKNQFHASKRAFIKWISAIAFQHNIHQFVGWIFVTTDLLNKTQWRNKCLPWSFQLLVYVFDQTQPETWMSQDAVRHHLPPKPIALCIQTLT